MALFGLLAALAVGVLAAGTVYVDAERRSLPPRSRRRWTAGVGIVGVGGVLVAFAVDGALLRAYLAVGGGPMVVRSPRALLTTALLFGLAIGAAAVLAYGVGSRYGPLRAA